MIDVEPLILEKLNRLVPEPGTGGLDWHEVERRAGGHRTPRGRVLAGTLVAAVIFVAVAIAQSLGGFSGWLTGEPGKPASTAEQQACSSAGSAPGPDSPGARSCSSSRRRTAGWRDPTSLDGFRGRGISICLRLLVTGQPDRRRARVPAALPAPREHRARDRRRGQLRGRAGKGSRPRPLYRFPILEFEPAALVTVGIVADGVNRVEADYSDGSGRASSRRRPMRSTIAARAELGRSAFSPTSGHSRAGRRVCTALRSFSRNRLSGRRPGGRLPRRSRRTDRAACSA